MHPTILELRRLSPSERGRGLGNRLLALLIVEARKIRLERLLLTIRSGNAASLSVALANGGKLEKSTDERRYIVIDLLFVFRSSISLREVFLNNAANPRSPSAREYQKKTAFFHRLSGAGGLIFLVFELRGQKSSLYPLTRACREGNAPHSFCTTKIS